jgi:hypothetical protein
MTSPPAPATPPRHTEPGPTAASKRVRRRPDALAAVVVIVAIGVLIAAVHHPQAGMYVAAGGLAAGALLRLLLRERDAGSLVVRIRRIDVVVLGGLAVAPAVLAAVTPFPNGSG